LSLYLAHSYVRYSLTYSKKPAITMRSLPGTR